MQHEDSRGACDVTLLVDKIIASAVSFDRRCNGIVVGFEAGRGGIVSREVFFCDLTGYWIILKVFLMDAVLGVFVVMLGGGMLSLQYMQSTCSLVACSTEAPTGPYQP